MALFVMLCLFLLFVLSCFGSHVNVTAGLTLEFRCRFSPSQFRYFIQLLGCLPASPLYGNRSLPEKKKEPCWAPAALSLGRRSACPALLRHPEPAALAVLQRCSCRPQDSARRPLQRCPRQRRPRLKAAGPGFIAVTSGPSWLHAGSAFVSLSCLC